MNFETWLITHSYARIGVYIIDNEVLRTLTLKEVTFLVDERSHERMITCWNCFCLSVKDSLAFHPLRIKEVLLLVRTLGQESVSRSCRHNMAKGVKK